MDDGIKEDVIRNVLKPCETLDYKETLLVELVNNVIDSLDRIKRIKPDVIICGNTLNDIKTSEINYRKGIMNKRVLFQDFS